MNGEGGACESAVLLNAVIFADHGYSAPDRRPVRSSLLILRFVFLTDAFIEPKRHDNEIWNDDGCSW